MKPPEHNLNVLLAIREMHSKDPTVVETDPWYLAQELYEGSYLNYLPSLSAVGAAQDVLLIEWGVGDVYDAAPAMTGPSIPRLLMKGS